MQNKVENLLNILFFSFTHIANETFTNFIWKYFLYHLLYFIIFKFIYKWLKIHSTKLSDIMLLPWWFERFWSLHFKKFWDNLRIDTYCFGGKLCKKVGKCIEKIFIGRNWELVPYVKDCGSELFSHEHSLHKAVHVASVA